MSQSPINDEPEYAAHGELPAQLMVEQFGGGFAWLSEASIHHVKEAHAIQAQDASLGYRTDNPRRRMNHSSNSTIETLKAAFRGALEGMQRRCRELYAEMAASGTGWGVSTVCILAYPPLVDKRT